MKLAGAGTALAVPVVAIGVRAYQEALGEPLPSRDPYVAIKHTTTLDGSVPLLVVWDQQAANPFGVYLTEILRAEGLNSFHTADLAELQPALLANYSILLLAETSLTAAQAEMVIAFVAGGGKLLGLKPDARLEAVFGWERSASASPIVDGYFKVEPKHLFSAGIHPESLQFHGSADAYSITSGEVVAQLYPGRDTASEHPAVVFNRHGLGLAAAFAFDVAQSVAYTRQGNPALVNEDIDGLDGVRSVDMFKGWVDLERIHIPQADELQRLLVNVLNGLSAHPLPRLWYFPKDKKSVLVATGDSHSNPAVFIDDVLARVDKYNGHMTVFYSPQIVDDVGRAERLARFWLTDHVPLVSSVLGSEFGSPTPDLVAGWRAQGHEFTLHPYVETGLAEWEVYWKEFTGRGYGPITPTVRTHRILWTGWMETARVQASHGMRMNFDYYHVGPSLQKPDGTWVYGHLTGSGRPMKFIDEQGRLIDLYQQLTQVTDEHLIPMDVPGWGGWPGLTPQQAVDVAKALFERSLTGEYTAICGQFHVDPFQLGGDPAEKGALFLEGTLASAEQLEIPILSAVEWLRFTDLRHDTQFTQLVWDAPASTLRFRLLPPNESAATLTILLPTSHAGKSLTALAVEGVTTPPMGRLVLGNAEYDLLLVPAREQSIQAIYA